MRLRINSLSLVGTTREIHLEQGLNVILGPISTGKTSLMKLLEALLGGSYRGVSVQVDRAVSELAGDLTIGDNRYSVIRALVQTDTARVQIAGDGVAERLPALRGEPGAPLTFGVWLLNQLGLPVIRVPQAPTRPAESAFTPVSVNDYMSYCRLRQDEIDVDVLGSSQPFRDIKRRYVFRILYGGYDEEVAQLQEDLRVVQTELTQLEAGRSAFERFLEGTSLENRAAIQQALTEADERLSILEERRLSLTSSERVTPTALRLRAEIAKHEERLSEAQRDLEHELSSAQQLEELANELQSQSVRLTRAIVAGERFFDFEFVTCPRCGAALEGEKEQEGVCRLCHQQEPPVPTREELVHEQDRINAQIAETDELVEGHRIRARDLENAVSHSQQERVSLGRRLDEEMAGFVSDEAELLERVAHERGGLEERVHRLREQLDLLQRLEDTSARIATLEERRRDVEAALSRAEQLDSISARRIETLEGWFAHFVDALEIPEFEDEVRAALDRNSYEPIVNGQRFSRLSAGVRVLVNVAHLLAHHRAALDLELPLPGLMLLDGVTKNIGTVGYDWERIEDIWRQLIELSDAFGDEIQMIVAVNDVPKHVEPYVRLVLSETDRLVPSEG